MTLLPLREMAISFGLMKEHPKSLRVKCGRKPFFTLESKVALAFLKSYTGLSVLKQMDALNSNILETRTCPGQSNCDGRFFWNTEKSIMA